MQHLFSDSDSQELKKIFKDLIKIKSINPPGDESEIAAYIKGIFDAEGIDCKTIKSGENRCNVYAKIPGGANKPILMISHTDVVPASSNWNFPAFEAYEKGGIIYGRGTQDTKQLTAYQIMTMLLIKRSCIVPNRDVIFIASADEENGSSYGMGYIKENYPELLPNSYVLSEGGGFVIYNNNKPYRICASGEKGLCDIKVIIKGDDNESLADKLCDIMIKLCAYESQEMICSLAQIFADTISPDLEFNDTTVANLWEYMTRNALVINSFDIDLSASKKEYELSVNMKFLPGSKKDEVLGLFDEILKGYEWQLLSYEEGYESNFDNPFTKMLQDKTDRYDKSIPTVPIIALGRTDGRFTQGDVYGFTPTLEDVPFDKVLTMVHQDDEHISVESLIFGAKVIADAICECIQKGDKTHA